MIAFRLMRYVIMAIENHLKQDHKELPLVIPLLFYCGKKPHPKSISMNWIDYFQRPEIAKRIYTQPFKIIDVTQIDDDELMNHKRLGILEYLLKHIYTRDLISMAKKLAHFLLLGVHSKEQLKSLLIYCYNHGKIKQPQQFIDALIQHTQPDGDDTMTTVAEYLRQQGLEAGEQKGSHNATLTIAKNMLVKGLDIVLIKEITGLSEDEIKKLHH